MADIHAAKSDAVVRLRAATGDAHARLDTRLDIVNVLFDPEGRRRLVGRFFGLHAGAEPVLEPFLGDLDGLDYAGRSRRPALDRDLGALGLDPAALPVCPVGAPASRAEALGFLYVLEGSTLGGRMIKREMAERGQDGPGLDFLDPYGARTGERWRDFLGILARECRPGDEGAVDAVVRGGTAGFERAETWLCGPLR